MLIHTLEQKSTTPVAHLALDMVSTMHKHQLAVPVFEVVQLSRLKLQKISVFGLNCQRLVIDATELSASEWTAVTIGELYLTVSNLNKSIWRHSQIQTLHSGFKLKSDSVLTSGLYQWTLTQCQLSFQRAELSAQLDWHIYKAQHKINTIKSPAKFERLEFMQTGHASGILSANFSPDGKQIVSASGGNSLKLWDLSSNCLQTFIGHTSEVLSANFSPDGKQIVSTSREICIWQLSPQSQPAWQLQHLWSSGYRLSFTDERLTAIQATDTAWQTLNFSNGVQTLSIDDHASFVLSESRNLEI